MLPEQPFYISVRQIILEAEPSLVNPGVVVFCGDYIADQSDQAPATLVLVYFKPNPQIPVTDIRIANANINAKDYEKLPLGIVDITSLLFRPIVNRLRFWDDKSPAQFTVHVHEVLKVSEDELRHSTTESSGYVHKQEDVVALLRSHCAEEEDIILTNLMVSLLCPLTTKKMRVPVRGMHCRHVQCFDVYSYLEVNESKLNPSWRCPVCKEPAVIEDIRVDMFTWNILRNVDYPCDAVVIKDDGSWQAVTTEQRLVTGRNNDDVNVID